MKTIEVKNKKPVAEMYGVQNKIDFQKLAVTKTIFCLTNEGIITEPSVNENEVHIKHKKDGVRKVLVVYSNVLIEDEWVFILNKDISDHIYVSFYMHYDNERLVIVDSNHLKGLSFFSIKK